MTTAINISKKVSKTDSILFLANEKLEGLSEFLTKEDIAYAEKALKTVKKKFFTFNQFSRFIFVEIIENKSEKHLTIEAYRNAGSNLLKKINGHKLKAITIVDGVNNAQKTLAAAEGMALGNYQFLKYFTKKSEMQNSLQEIAVLSKEVSKKETEYLQAVVDGVCHSRDLVNEPVSYLDAVQFSKDIEKHGKEAGFKVEILNKKKIEALKMGGVLAVNLGSPTPPTFTILEWKPAKCNNKKPIVLVGKGIVYDTGGLSLKPTPNSMDLMKSDMGGGAAVLGAIYAIAKAKIPVHVVGLIPATDNRPGQNAYAPGDVITMYDGTTVEVLNTDAEGRLVLADALTYAKKFNPELVIDLATLTGAAVRGFGTKSIVSMGTADEAHLELEKSGYRVFERLAKQPFWDDYAEGLKSKIADMNNLGGAFAGQITAGKFLEHFTKDKKGKTIYPWLHLDIAGPAFLSSNETYRPAGGTGAGVRVLVDYINSLA